MAYTARELLTRAFAPSSILVMSENRPALLPTGKTIGDVVPSVTINLQKSFGNLFLAF
jgi:hypothetical protein